MRSAFLLSEIQYAVPMMQLYMALPYSQPILPLEFERFIKVLVGYSDFIGMQRSPEDEVAQQV